MLAQMHLRKAIGSKPLVKHSPPLEGVRALVREGDSILGFYHYNAGVQIETTSGHNVGFWLAGLSPDEPVTAYATDSCVLLLGSYQKLYGVAIPSMDVVFENELLYVGAVSGLPVIRTAVDGESAIVVTDATVARIDVRGVKIWEVDFPDPVEMLGCDPNEVRVRSVTPNGNGMLCIGRFNVSDGKYVLTA